MSRNEKISCKYCDGTCVKNGYHKTGTQRFICKSCRKSQQKDYLYQAYNNINGYITAYIKEGVGIRSIARLLHISSTTLLKRIIKISSEVKIPPVAANSVFEVDEIKTFLGKKKNHIWIAYALNRKDNSVACFTPF